MLSFIFIKPCPDSHTPTHVHSCQVITSLLAQLITNDATIFITYVNGILKFKPFRQYLTIDNGSTA